MLVCIYRTFLEFVKNQSENPVCVFQTFNAEKIHSMNEDPQPK